jgi:hypothetical protein
VYPRFLARTAAIFGPRPRHEIGIVLQDGGALLEELLEVLGLPGDGRCLKRLDGPQRDIASLDVRHVLGRQQRAEPLAVIPATPSQAPARASSRLTGARGLGSSAMGVTLALKRKDLLL